MNIKNKIFKITAIFLCLILALQQSGFAQIAGQLDISGHLAALRQSLASDKFRPLHLRYLNYDNQNNVFKLLLDKGDFVSEEAEGGEATEGEARGSAESDRTRPIANETKTLLNYFFIGVSLPNDTFWVNLRPDSPDEMIDPLLAQTDVGKILLEADLQLKKDTAKFTSPETREGREYWDKLYKKAGEIFGSQNITIPTLTRPWIVPDEIIIRESDTNAYIYKATLKVMLEEDYLTQNTVGANGRSPLQAQYEFKDPRLKELNEYSSRLIRELIIPKITKEINSSKRYAPLRQVYYSLIMAQWFKLKFAGKPGQYSSLIDRKNLDGLASKTYWDKHAYFNAYKESFEKGEYNIKEPAYTLYGQTIRSYFSGGITMAQTGAAMAQAISRPGQTITGGAGTAVTVTHPDKPDSAVITRHPMQAVTRDPQGRLDISNDVGGEAIKISERDGRSRQAPLLQVSVQSVQQRVLLRYNENLTVFDRSAGSGAIAGISSEVIDIYTGENSSLNVLSSAQILSLLANDQLEAVGIRARMDPEYGADPIVRIAQEADSVVTELNYLELSNKLAGLTEQQAKVFIEVLLSWAAAAREALRLGLSSADASQAAMIAEANVFSIRSQGLSAPERDELKRRLWEKRQVYMSVQHDVGSLMVLMSGELGLSLNAEDVHRIGLDPLEVAGTMYLPTPIDFINIAREDIGKGDYYGEEIGHKLRTRAEERGSVQQNAAERKLGEQDRKSVDEFFGRIGRVLARVITQENSLAGLFAQEDSTEWSNPQELLSALRNSHIDARMNNLVRIPERIMDELEVTFFKKVEEVMGRINRAHEEIKGKPEAGNKLAQLLEKEAATWETYLDGIMKKYEDLLLFNLDIFLQGLLFANNLVVCAEKIKLSRNSQQIQDSLNGLGDPASNARIELSKKAALLNYTFSDKTESQLWHARGYAAAELFMKNNPDWRKKLPALIRMPSEQVFSEYVNTAEVSALIEKYSNEARAGFAAGAARSENVIQAIYTAQQIRDALDCHELDLRRGEYATKPLSLEEITDGTQLDLTPGSEYIVLNGARQAVHKKDNHYWIEGGGMPERDIQARQTSGKYAVGQKVWDGDGTEWTVTGINELPDGRSEVVMNSAKRGKQTAYEDDIARLYSLRSPNMPVGMQGEGLVEGFLKAADSAALRDRAYAFAEEIDSKALEEAGDLDSEPNSFYEKRKEILDPILAKYSVTFGTFLKELNKSDRLAWIVRLPCTYKQLVELLDRNTEFGFSVLEGLNGRKYLYVERGVVVPKGRYSYGEGGGMAKCALGALSKINGHSHPRNTETDPSDEDYDTDITDPDDHNFILMFNGRTIEMSDQEKGTSDFLQIKDEQQVMERLDDLGILKGPWVSGPGAAAERTQIIRNELVHFFSAERIQIGEDDPAILLLAKRILEAQIANQGLGAKNINLSGINIPGLDKINPDEFRFLGMMGGMPVDEPQRQDVARPQPGPGAADKRPIAERVVGLFRGSTSSFINAKIIAGVALEIIAVIALGSVLTSIDWIWEIARIVEIEDIAGHENILAIKLLFAWLDSALIGIIGVELVNYFRGKESIFGIAPRVTTLRRNINARTDAERMQPGRTRKQRISQDIAGLIEGLAEKEVGQSNKNREHWWQQGYEVDKNGITRDAENLRFYASYAQTWKGNPLYWLAPKSIIYERVAQAHFREYVRLEKPLAGDVAGGASSGAGGGGSSGLGGGGTGQAVRGFGLTADTRYSRDTIQRLLDLAVETLSMKTPKALASCDAEANAEHKISALEDILHLSDGQKDALRPLIRRYFALERLVHRIKHSYVTGGRINLLSRTKWNIFSHKDFQDILRPLVYDDAVQADDIDFLSAFGEGAGLETAIDKFFGSDELVSMTLEAFDSLDSRAGTGFEHTGIAIVYSPAIEQDSQMMAVNAPDEDLLSQRGLFLDEAAEELDQQLKAEVLTLEGIRKLREEMVLRQGQRESQLVSIGTYLQGPFDPREAMVSGGVKGKYIEIVVVADGLFDLVYSRSPAMRNKLVKASEYFKRTEGGEFENARLREIEALRGQIFRTLTEKSKDDTGASNINYGGASPVSAERRYGTEELKQALPGEVDLRWPEKGKDGKYLKVTPDQITDPDAELVIGPESATLVNNAVNTFQRITDGGETFYLMTGGGGMPKKNLGSDKPQPPGGPGAAGEKAQEWKPKLRDELRKKGNPDEEIDKAIWLIEAGRAQGKEIILEIGCGNAKVAWEIANKNPNVTVIATDAYFIDNSYSIYESWAAAFETHKTDKRTGLKGQVHPLPNLVILRSVSDILAMLSDNALDYILIVNPEEGVVKELFADQELLRNKVKMGVVIKPAASFRSLAEGEIGPTELDFKNAGETLWGVNINNVSSFSSTGNKAVWIGPWKEKGRSIAPQKGQDLGGIDFTGNMPIVTQPIPGQPAARPGLQLSNSPAIQPKVDPELIKKWEDIQKLLRADIPPSPERLKEYLQACCSNDIVDKEIDKVLGCIADILRMEEERCSGTDESLKEILVMLEQSPSANFANTLQMINVSAGEPN